MNITIIYGENDTMVNPNLVSNILKDFNIKFMKDGGHDIANTHTKELINIIKHIK